MKLLYTRTQYYALVCRNLTSLYEERT